MSLAARVNDLATAVAAQIKNLNTTYISKTLIDAKGDILVGNADNVIARVPVGTNGQALLANSAATNGVAWGDVGSSLPTDYVDTTPATPATGVSIFARRKARRELAYVDPTGLDTRIQGSVAHNRLSTLRAIAGVATPEVWGMSAPTNVGTLSAQTPSSFTIPTYVQKLRYATATGTAGAACGFRGALAFLTLSSNAHAGGFHATFKFLGNGQTSASRMFVGLMGSTAAASGTVDPSTFVNMIGVGADAADTTWQIMVNDSSGVATKTNTGLSKSDTQGFWEVNIFSASGSGQSVYVSITDITNNVTFQLGPITTNLPGLAIFLNYYFHLSTGTSTLGMSLDFHQMVIETDN